MRLKSFNLLNALSMRQRSLYRRLLKLNGCFLSQRFGMTGLVPRSSTRTVQRPFSHLYHLQQIRASPSLRRHSSKILESPEKGRSESAALVEFGALQLLVQADHQIGFQQTPVIVPVKRN